MLDVWPIVFGGLLLAWVAWCYNRLIRLRNMVNTAWSDIDVQLTRRHDLIPQLVRTVNAYTRHERALLATVTELRAQALRTDRPATLAPLETQLERSLRSEEHTSELQSRGHLVCRLLLEKKTCRPHAQQKVRTIQECVQRLRNDRVHG